MNTIEPKSDEEWMAEEDARTLGMANTIMADPDRLSKAQKAAEKLAKEKEDEVKGLNAIASFSYPDMGKDRE